MANRDYYPHGPAESARDREIAEKHLSYLLESKLYLDKTAFMQYAEAITNDLLGITYGRKEKAMKKRQNARQNQRQTNNMVTSEMKMASLTSLEKVKHLRSQLQEGMGAYDDEDEDQFEQSDYQHRHRQQQQYRQEPPQNYDSNSRQRQSLPRQQSSSRDRSPNRPSSQQPSSQQRQPRPQQQRSSHYPPPPPASQIQVQEEYQDDEGYDQVIEERDEIAKVTDTNYHRTELGPIDEHDQRDKDEEACDQASQEVQDHEEAEYEDDLLPPAPRTTILENITASVQERSDLKQQQPTRSIDTQVMSPSSTRSFVANDKAEELLPLPMVVSKPSSVSPRPPQQQQQLFQDRPPLHQQQRQASGRSRSPSPAQIQAQRSFMRNNKDEEDDEIDLSGNWVRPREQSIERLYPDVGAEDDEDIYDYVYRAPKQHPERRLERDGISSYKERQPTEIHIHNNNYHPSGGLPAPPLIDYDPSSSRYVQQQRSSTSPLRDSRVVKYNTGTETLRDSIDLSGLSLHRLRDLTGHY